MNIEYLHITKENAKKEITDKRMEDIIVLIKQLTNLPSERTKQDLIDVTNAGSMIFAIDTDTEKVIGIGTISITIKPSASESRIDDVVVHIDYRGQGIGEKITRLLIKEAIRNHIDHIELTTTPSQVAANHLYQKLGFVLRETNVYRLRPY